MKRLATLLIAALLGGAVVGALLLRTAWTRHRAAVEQSLDPLGPPPDPLPTTDAAHPRVMLFGDSRVAMWSPLPEIPGVSFVVRGRAGETTALARLRLRRDLEAVRPDVVVFETGVNDLKAVGFFPERAASIAAATEANLHALLETAGADARPVVLLTVVPPARLDLQHRLVWSGDVEETVRAANRRLRDWKADRLTIFDCDPVLAAHGRLEARFAADTLHLNAAGYQALNAALTPVLARILAARTAGAVTPPGDAAATGAAADTTSR